MTLAEPPSQTLGITKMPGVSCSARKRIALSRWLGMALTPRRAPVAAPAPRYTLAQFLTRKPAPVIRLIALALALALGAAAELHGAENIPSIAASPSPPWPRRRWGSRRRP